MKRCLKCNKFIKPTVDYCEKCIKSTHQSLATYFFDNGRYDLEAERYVEPFLKYLSEHGLPDNDKSMDLFLKHYVNKRKRAPGAGRPKIGSSRKLTLNFPEEEWEVIDDIIGGKNYSSYAEYFRHLHLCARSGLMPQDYQSN